MNAYSTIKCYIWIGRWRLIQPII